MSSRSEGRAVVVIGLPLAVSAIVLPYFPAALAVVNTAATAVLGVAILGVVVMVIRDVWL